MGGSVEGEPRARAHMEGSTAPTRLGSAGWLCSRQKERERLVRCWLLRRDAHEAFGTFGHASTQASQPRPLAPLGGTRVSARVSEERRVSRHAGDTFWHTRGDEDRVCTNDRNIQYHGLFSCVL